MNNPYHIFLLRSLWCKEYGESYKSVLSSNGRKKLQEKTLLGEKTIGRFYGIGKDSGRDPRIETLDVLCSKLRENYNWEKFKKEFPTPFPSNIGINKLSSSIKNEILEEVYECIEKLVEIDKHQKSGGIEIKNFAKRIYVELTTRKIAIPINEEIDVIEEVYNSWYKLFSVFRDELKLLSVESLRDINNSETIIGRTNEVFNITLRLHLTEHQAKYRHWLEKAKRNSEFKELSPQELQKKYPSYKILLKSLIETNESLIGFSEKFSNFIK